MKNADMPAMPTWELNGKGEQEMTGTGLTKYEHVLLELTKALIIGGQTDAEGAIIRAQRIADVYFKRLDGRANRCRRQHEKQLNDPE